MARKPRKKKPAPGPVFELQLRTLKLPKPEPEWRFHPHRLWRLDYAWPALKYAVEIEGITYFGKNKDGSLKLSRHQTAKGISEDCIKYAEALALGWTLSRFTQDHVHAGVAIGYVETELRKRMTRARMIAGLAARVAP